MGVTRRTNHTFKAQPVRFRGTSYRSTTEARWATLFTTLGVAFRYEPRVFRTAEGGYCPDFYVLEERPFWVEVKGPEPTERDYRRALAVQDRTKEKLRYFVGRLPLAPSRGVLRTRISRGRTWYQADWRTPWGAKRLDAALAVAHRAEFEPAPRSDFPW